MILFVLATVAMLGCTGGEQAVETGTETAEALETIASEAQPSTAAAEEEEEETHISIEMLEVSGGTFQRNGDANLDFTSLYLIIIYS